ncbi:acylphosphatase [Candidatus Woesearchaeota archaeon]|nr:acylphosphatase [Candidatus Woesearchaeota archaeon]
MYRYLISGKVQGVGFRYYVQKNAQRLGIKGYVRNYGPDVELVTTIKDFFEKADEPPLHSSISKIGVSFVEEKVPDEFKIRQSVL